MFSSHALPMRASNPRLAIVAMLALVFVGLAGLLISIGLLPIFGTIALGAFVVLSFLDFEFSLLIFIFLIPFDPQREILPNLPIYLNLARVFLIPGFVYQVMKGGLPRVPRWTYFFWVYCLICGLTGYVYVIDQMIFFKEISKLLLDVCFAWMVAAGLNSAEKIVRALKVILVASLLVSTYAIYQMAINGYGRLWEWMNPRLMDLGDWMGRATGFMSQPNELGGFVNLLIPFGFALAFYLRSSMWRRFAAFATGLLLVCLLISFSRGAWVAFAVIVALRIMSQRRFAYAGAVLLIGAVMSLVVITRLEEAKWLVRERGTTIDTETFEGRMKVMRTAVMMFSDHPIAGIGYSNYSQTMKDYMRWNAPLVGAHNLYLQILSETGLLGFAFFMIPCSLLLFHCLRRYRLATDRDPALRIVMLGCSGSVLSVFIHGFIDFLFRSHEVSQMFWFSIGAMLVVVRAPSGLLAKKPHRTPGQAHWAEASLAVAKTH